MNPTLPRPAGQLGVLIGAAALAVGSAGAAVALGPVALALPAGALCLALLVRHPPVLLALFLHVGVFKGASAFDAFPVDVTAALGLLLAAVCLHRALEGRSARARGGGRAGGRDRDPGAARADLDPCARLRDGEGGQVPDADAGLRHRGLLRDRAAAGPARAAVGGGGPRRPCGGRVGGRSGLGGGRPARVRRAGQHHLHVASHLQRRARAAPRLGPADPAALDAGGAATRSARSRRRGGGHRVPWTAPQPRPGAGLRARRVPGEKATAARCPRW